MKLTEEQFKVQEELVKTLKHKIYPKNGHEHNLHTVRKIAIAAGLEKPFVERCRTFNWTTINCEVIDPYGIADEEIRAIFQFCIWLKAQYEIWENSNPTK